MDLVSVHPVFNLYNRKWPILTSVPALPPAKFVFQDEGRTGQALDTLVSPGVIVSGGCVRRSVLSPHVRVHSGADVEGSVLMHGVDVGRGAVVRNAILDKNVVVWPGAPWGRPGGRPGAGLPRHRGRRDRGRQGRPGRPLGGPAARRPPAPPARWPPRPPA